MGFKDGARVVQYYSKDTRRILTSRNYKYIETNTLPTVDETTDSSVDQRDRGPGTGTILMPAHNASFAGPHKRKSCGEVNPSSRKMRGVYIDNKQLEDLFSDTDEDEDSMISIQFIRHTMLVQMTPPLI